MYVFIMYVFLYYVCIYLFNYLYVSYVQVTCMYDTNKSRFPCSMCMCQKSSLSSVEGQDHEYRAGGETEFGNPYRAINVDMLHQANLGIFKTIVEIVQNMGKQLTSNPLLELDRRLMIIKETSRFFQFQVPGTNKGGYSSSNASYAAFEHRCIMQVSSNQIFTQFFTL